MKKNFILFGPPGIGKSTIIKSLKSLGFNAIDLEDCKDEERTDIVINQEKNNTIFGGANISPSKKYNDTEKILLILSEKEYKARRKKRDSKNIEKASQLKFQVRDFLINNKYDHIIKADDSVVKNIIDIIQNKKS